MSTGRGARPLHCSTPAQGGSCSPQGYVLPMVSSRSQERVRLRQRDMETSSGCVALIASKRGRMEVTKGIRVTWGTWQPRRCSRSLELGGLQDAAPRGHGHGLSRRVRACKARGIPPGGEHGARGARAVSVPGVTLSPQVPGLGPKLPGAAATQPALNKALGQAGEMPCLCCFSPSQPSSQPRWK